MLPKSTKIIFLDIDGVLNHNLFYEERHEKYGYDIPRPDKYAGDFHNIDQKALKLLSDFVVENNITVVLSSTWRKYNTIEYFNELFKDLGAEFELYDKTPYLYLDRDCGCTNSVPRGFEILTWIGENIEDCGDKYTNYIILDDDSDMLLWQQNNYMQVDPWSGLTKNHIYRMGRQLV